MILLFRIPSQVAVSTALFMIVITSAVGSLAHYSIGQLHTRLGLTLGAAFLLGAVLAHLRPLATGKGRLTSWIAGALVLVGLTMFTVSVVGSG
jgi:uncharacterized membrane protein YfcA